MKLTTTVLISIGTLFMETQVKALDNAIRLTPPITYTNYPESLAQNFVDGEIANYPQPFINGTSAGVWQTDQVKRYPSGYVRRAVVSFTYNAVANTEAVVSFVNNVNPCSAGNQVACDAAAMTQTQMLNAAGGTWNSTMTVTANPAGSTSARTFDTRDALTNGHWQYWLKGPALTSVIVGDQSPARTRDFGFKQRRYMYLASQINDGTATTINVNGSDWSTLSRPFRIFIQNELISICFVNGSQLTVGLTNGSDPSCANVSGRGVGGTSPTFHFLGSHGAVVQLDDSGIRLTVQAFSGDTTLTVNDASAFNSVTIIQVAEEQIRVCNKSGNVLTVGTASWPCSANSGGRAWRGSNIGYSNGSHYGAVGTPVYRIAVRDPLLPIDTEIADRWVDAPSDNFKSIHTRVQLNFPHTLDKVGIRYSVLNGVFMDRMQDQRVDFLFSFTGTAPVPSSYGIQNVEFRGRTLLAFPRADHYTGQDTMWWIGGNHLNVTRVKKDFNRNYQFASGKLLNDPATQVSESAIQTFLDTGFQSSVGLAPAWNDGDRCGPDTVAGTSSTVGGNYSAYSGPSVRAINAPGGRDELLFGKFIAMFAHSWDKPVTVNSRTREIIENLPSCQGKIPYHYLEGNDVTGFCDGWGYAANTADKACSGANLTASTFNRVPSQIKYPSISPGNQNTVSSSTDKRFPTGIINSGGFIATISGTWSHNPSLQYWNALYSSDYYSWLVTMLTAGSSLVSNDFTGWNPADNTSARINARGPWSASLMNDGSRRWAYQIKEITQGAIMALPGSPEEQYFEAWLKRDAAIWEGRFNYQAGNYYIPCPANVASTLAYDHSPWCWGWWRGFNPTDSTNPFWVTEIGNQFQAGSGTVNYLRTYTLASAWMDAYLFTAFEYRNRNVLPSGTKFTEAIIARNYLQKMADHQVGGLRPLLFSVYQLPANTCRPEGSDVSPNCSSLVNSPGTQQGFAVYSNWVQGFLASNRDITVPSGNNDGDLQSGYSVLSGIVPRLFPKLRYDNGTRIMTAKYVHEFWQANLRGYKTGVQTNPYWDFGLWVVPTVKISAGDTAIRLTTDEVMYSSTCRATMIASPFSNWDDSADVAMTKIGQYAERTFTGLSPNTTYYWRVNCGELRTNGTATTTAAAGAGMVLSIKNVVPAGMGVATIRTTYGPTVSLGSTLDTPCTSGSCTITLPANKGRALFYRHAYLTGSGNTIVQESQVRSTVP